MRLLSRFLIPVVACSASVLGGCESEPERDRDPPRVLSVEPTSGRVPVTTSFKIQFSEPLNDLTVSGDVVGDNLSVVLVPRASVVDAFLADLDSPPLIASRQAQVVPADVRLRDQDAAIEISPNEPLDPRTAYVILVASEVRDTSGNPLVDATGNKAAFRYDFTTDDGEPAVVSTDAVSAEQTLLAPNRRRITVTFNQPVQNVTTSTLFFEPKVALEAILLNEARDEATLFLATPADGCARITPSSQVALAATSDIIGDTDQALTPFRQELTTGAGCDETPQLILAPPTGVAGEVNASVRFESSKASTTELRFGVEGGPLDCAGAACPVVGSPARVPLQGSSPPQFVHSVELTGLTVGLRYDFVVSAEDDVGQVASRSGSFVTAPLPKVSLNEVMANPPAGAGAEGVAEFVELANFGDVAVDLSGWALQVDGGNDGGGKTCSLPENGTAPILAAGGFLVLGGSGFSGAAYGGVDEAKIFRFSGSTVCGALVNTRAQSFVLTDGDGRPVSSISGYASLLPGDGQSLERTGADAGDVQDSFCLSLGGTPGAANAASITGCRR